MLNESYKGSVTYNTLAKMYGDDVSKNPWQEAVDRRLTAWHMTADQFPTALEAVDALISAECDATLDPKINRNAALFKNNTLEMACRVICISNVSDEVCEELIDRIRELKEAL